MNEETKFPVSAVAPAARTAHYEEDAIYQDGKIVARVEGAEIRWSHERFTLMSSVRATPWCCPRNVNTKSTG